MVKMQQELYACLKMMESLNKNSIKIYNTRRFEPAGSMLSQYNSITKILKKHLNKSQIGFIPVIHNRNISFDGDKAGLLLELVSASDITISFLRSLEGDLDKELRLKEYEIERLKKEHESSKKLFDKGTGVIRELIEAQRSGAVVDWKKKHREIEKHSKQST